MTSDAVLPPGELEAVFGDGAAPVTVERCYEPVASASLGIWRVRHGSASAVLKVVAHSLAGHENWPSSDDMHDWYFWRREVCAYESGVLDDLTGGLRAPSLRLVAPRDDGSVALWLEDVAGRPGSIWTVDDYAPAARRLGHAQGTFAVHGPPSHAWLSRNWLRGYLRQRAPIIDALDDHEVTSVLDRVLGTGAANRARSLRAYNATLLDALDTLPRTLCHLDLHPANLFDDGASTVVIDWAFTGIGALAEDPGNLVPDSVFDFHVDPTQLDDLYDVVASNYETGLREAGWNGRTEHVRFGMAASIAAKYVWIAPATGRAIADGREQLNRRSIDETLHWWVPTARFVFDRGDEALALLGSATG